MDPNSKAMAEANDQLIILGGCDGEFLDERADGSWWHNRSGDWILFNIYGDAGACVSLRVSTFPTIST